MDVNSPSAADSFSHPAAADSQSAAPTVTAVTLANFQQEVIDRSLQMPVVVDFWAPWCGPCKTLKPLLEKLAAEFRGRLALVTINADEAPQLAQSFAVRSIPAVKVVDQGQLIDEFTGALPEKELRAFLQRVALPASAADGSGDVRAQVAQLKEAGQLDEALALIAAASQNDPAQAKNEALRLDGVDILLTLERFEDAAALLSVPYEQENERAQALQKRLSLLQNAPDIAPLQAALAANADDHASRLALAKAYAAAGRLSDALQEALTVLAHDRFFNDGEARKTLLELFAAFDGEAYEDEVRRARRKMSALLN